MPNIVAPSPSQLPSAMKGGREGGSLPPRQQQHQSSAIQNPNCNSVFKSFASELAVLTLPRSPKEKVTFAELNDVAGVLEEATQPCDLNSSGGGGGGGEVIELPDSGSIL